MVVIVYTSSKKAGQMEKALSACTNTKMSENQYTWMEQLHIP